MTKEKAKIIAARSLIQFFSTWIKPRGEALFEFEQEGRQFFAIHFWVENF